MSCQQEKPTALEISEAIRAHRQSVSDVVDIYLARIESENEFHHAFKSVFADDARRQARVLDEELAAGKSRGPLHGIPIAVKDNIDIAGQSATAGSLARRATVATADAPVIERLRAAGAVIIGQTHMVEFAFGGWGTNSAMGTPRNPLDRLHHRVPGGSSSGSAVAVAADLAPLALGTDTGGSVRIPAAMTGLVGFKPSWGLTPDEGLTTLCRRFDVIGPMSRNVADCWALFDVMTAAPGSEARKLPVLDRPLRIGVADPVAYGSFSARVLSAFREVCQLLSRRGLALEPFAFPVDVNEVLTRTGCLIGHEAAREFGETLSAKPCSLDRGVHYRLSDARRFTPDDYEREWVIRDQRSAEMRHAVAGFDALLFPTAPVLPPRLDEIIERAMPLGDLTRVINYLDLCAMALPTQRTPEGLRHSLQVIGPKGGDHLIFALSAEIERIVADMEGEIR